MTDALAFGSGLAANAGCCHTLNRAELMSDRVTEMPGLDQRIDDLRAVMDAAGMEQAAVMGLSEGGSLAALFAATYPNRCSALILCGAFARFSSWFPTEEAFAQFLGYVGQAWGSGVAAPFFIPSRANDPAFQRWFGRLERLGATPASVAAYMRMNSQIDISDVLPTIQAPTLVIHRTGDVTINIEGGRYLAEHIPGARLQARSALLPTTSKKGCRRADAVHPRPRLRDSFLSRSSVAISAMASSFLASARAIARIARWTEERGISVASEIMRMLKPGLIRSSTTKRRRAVSLRVPDSVPVFANGSHHKLAEDFLAQLDRSWQQHGREMLAWLRAERPKVYFKAMVRLTEVLHCRLPEPPKFDRSRIRADVLQRLQERTENARQG